MSRSSELLKLRYLKNIKENPELFVGIELEYPVTNLEGDATDVEVIKRLFRYLVSALNLAVEKVDDFGNPIQLVDPVSQDAILFLHQFHNILLCTHSTYKLLDLGCKP